MSASIIPLQIADFERYMQSDAKMPPIFLSQLQNGLCTVFLYVDTQQPCGEIALVTQMPDTLLTIPGKRASLSRLMVSSAYRRRGIGTQLLTYACACAKAQGYTEITIYVSRNNAPANALYAANGFTTVLQEGIDELGAFTVLMKSL